MGMEITLESFSYGGSENIVVPEGVTRIRKEVFRGCKQLKKIELPSSLIVIEKDAFNGCFALEEIIIPDNVTEIGERAFRNCSRLKRAALPNSLIALKPYTFSLCKSLEVLEGGSSIEHLGKECFAGCKCLSELSFQKSLVTIGKQAFSSCAMLKELDFGTELERIEQEAFRGCKSLSIVSIPRDVGFLGKNLFSGCSQSMNIIGFEVVAQRFPDALPKSMLENVGKLRPQDVSQYKKDYVAAHANEIAQEKKNYLHLEQKLDELLKKRHSLFSFKHTKLDIEEEISSLELQIKASKQKLKKLHNPDEDELIKFLSLN